MSDELKQSVKDAIKKAEKVMQQKKKAVDQATVEYKQASRTLNALLATLRQMGVSAAAPGKMRGAGKQALRDVVLAVMKEGRESGTLFMSPVEVYELAQQRVACSKGAVAFNLQQLNREGLVSRPARGKYRYEMELEETPKKKLPAKSKKTTKKKPARKRRKKPAKK